MKHYIKLFSGQTVMLQQNPTTKVFYVVINGCQCALYPQESKIDPKGRTLTDWTPVTFKTLTELNSQTLASTEGLKTKELNNDTM